MNRGDYKAIFNFFLGRVGEAEIKEVPEGAGKNEVKKISIKTDLKKNIGKKGTIEVPREKVEIDVTDTKEQIEKKFNNSIIMKEYREDLSNKFYQLFKLHKEIMSEDYILHQRILYFYRYIRDIEGNNIDYESYLEIFMLLKSVDSKFEADLIFQEIKHDLYMRSLQHAEIKNELHLKYEECLEKNKDPYLIKLQDLNKFHINPCQAQDIKNGLCINYIQNLEIKKNLYKRSIQDLGQEDYEYINSTQNLEIVKELKLSALKQNKKFASRNIKNLINILKILGQNPQIFGDLIKIIIVLIENNIQEEIKTIDLIQSINNNEGPPPENSESLISPYFDLIQKYKKIEKANKIEFKFIYHTISNRLINYFYQKRGTI